MRRLFCGGGAVSAAVPLALLLAFSPSPAQAQEETTILDPLVVTATRTERPLSTVGSSLTVITAEDLENRQTTYVADILREVPGVAVNRMGGPGGLTEVRIRGAENNHTLVLIDGIEVNNPAGESFFDFAHLLAEDIERIEVLRGPQSVLYGSEAVGGVVNIITKRGQDRPRFSGSIEGGSFRTGKANASLSTGGERYDFLVSATHLRTDGISTAKHPRGDTDSDEYENTTAFAKLGVSPIGNLRFDFTARFTDYKQDYDSDADSKGRLIESDYHSRGSQAFGRAQATLDLFDGHWQQQFGASFSRLKAKNYAGGSRSSTTKGKRTKFDYQSDVHFKPPKIAGAQHLMTLGLEHEVEDADLDYGSIGLKRDFTTRSIFGQYQLDLFERLSLSAGFRQDLNNEFKNAQTYRLTAAYSLVETGTRLHAAYGTGVKNPTLSELYGFDATYQGNADLKPEKSRGWEVGVGQTLFGERLSLEATYFDQKIEDLIVGAGNTSINIDGYSRSRGVELISTLSLADGLTLSGSYTYNHTKDADGDRLLRRPLHKASVNVNYRFLEDRANLNLSYLYNGSQQDVAWPPWPNPMRVVTLHSYNLVSLAGSYQVTDNFEVFGRVENALNDSYEEIYSYNTPGRAAYAGLRIRF